MTEELERSLERLVNSRRKFSVVKRYEGEKTSKVMKRMY